MSRRIWKKQGSTHFTHCRAQCRALGDIVEIRDCRTSSVGVDAVAQFVVVDVVAQFVVVIAQGHGGLAQFFA